MTLKEMRQMRRAGLLNVKEKGMTICSIMNRCLVMFLRGQKVNARAVLMKHRRKGKGGQVIIL